MKPQPTKPRKLDAFGKLMIVSILAICAVVYFRKRATPIDQSAEIEKAFKTGVFLGQVYTATYYETNKSLNGLPRAENIIWRDYTNGHARVIKQ